MVHSVKVLFFWILIAVSALLLWEVIRTAPRQQRPEITYSTFIAQAQAGQIARVTVTGSDIRGSYRDGGWFHLTGPENPAAYLPLLQNNGVEIVFQNAPRQSVGMQLLGTWAPLLLLAALWFLMIRRMTLRNPPPPPDSGIPQGTIDPSTGQLR